MRAAAIFGAVLFLGLLGAWFLIPDTKAPESLETVRLATNPGVFPSNFLSFVGTETGIFERSGIRIELEEMQVSVSAAALMGGSVELSPFSRSNAAAALQGAPVRYIYSLTEAQSFYLVGQPGMEIGNIRTLGVSGKYDQVHMTAAYAADKHAIRPEIVEAGGSSIALRALLSEGRVDAIVVGLPAPFDFESQGFVILDRFEEFRMPLGLFASEEALAARPDTFRRTLAAFEETKRFVVENPDETKRFIKEFFSLEDDVQADARYAAARELFVGTPVPSDAAAEILLKAAKASVFETWQDIEGQTIAEEDRATVFDLRFLPDHD